MPNLQTLLQRRTLAASLFALFTLLLSGAAFADDAKIDSGDTAWLLVSTGFVLLMTIPGLALFYGGLVRRKNVVSTVAQSFATTAVIAVVWSVVGYTLAFTNGVGELAPVIGDLSRLFIKGMDLNKPFILGAGTGAAAATTIPESVFMMFQMTFAIITPALIAGAFAERMKFSAMLWFMALWSLLVYCPIAHWMWQPNGFMSARGMLDFAGGTVVHVNAGIAGLVLAVMMGKRIGYKQEPFKPYSSLLSLVGASLLWVGWFGFNAGSELAANGRAGMAMTVTMVATAMSALCWMFTEWKIHGKPSAFGMTSGAVAGLVAITPACGYVDVEGALWIGALAGILCYFAADRLKQKLGYDDSLDCFGVHGIGGIIGAFLTGIFATSAITGTDTMRGWIDGNPAQVFVQMEGIVCTIIWCGVMTFLIGAVLDKTIGLRVPAAEEREGLDLAIHGEAI